MQILFDSSDGIEKKLFARSVAVYQELGVFCFIFSDKDIQFNIATVVEVIA